MKKFTKTVALAVCSVLTLGSLSACGGGDDGTILIGFTDAGYGHAFLEETIARFERAYPEYNVEYEGDAKFTDKVNNYVNNGSNYDIMFSMKQLWQEWAAKGKLEDLNEVYATVVDGDTVENKMLDAFQDYGKAEGNDGVDRYYVMPWNDGVTGIVYNANMFDEYGWEIPTTVAELVALCGEIKADTNNTVKPFVYPGQYANYWEFIGNVWWAQYEGIDNFNYFFTYENRDVFSQQGRLKALQAFESLSLRENGTDPDLECNAVIGSLSMNHIEAQMSFLNGEAAMIPNGSWIETEIKESMPDGFRIKMMKTPYIDTKHKVDMNWTSAGDFICIPKDAKHKEGAKKFIAFMCTDENLQMYSSYTNTMRPFRYDTTEVKKNLSEFGKGVFDIWGDENSTNLYEVSHSPLYTMGYIAKWPATSIPWGAMLSTSEVMSARDVFDAEINYVNGKWAEWQSQIN